jgi:hypothetical protein
MRGLRADEQATLGMLVSMRDAAKRAARPGRARAPRRGSVVPASATMPA